MQLWACEWMVSRNWLLASSWCDLVSLCAWNKQYQYKYTRIGSTVGHEFQIRNINDEKADMQFFWCNFISYKKKTCQQIVKVCVRVSKQFNRPLFQSYVVFMALAAVKQLESRWIYRARKQERTCENDSVLCSISWTQSRSRTKNSDLIKTNWKLPVKWIIILGIDQDLACEFVEQKKQVY